VRPEALIAAEEPTSALLLASARLIATAAPMVAELPGGARAAADPSALARASVFAVETRLTVPPVFRVTAPKDASDRVLAMLTAIAAATLIAPSGVCAGGVVGAGPEPPPAGATVSPKDRWALAC